MNIDPVLPQAVGIISLVLLVGVILRLMKQPHVVAYLITGILIGPWGIELVKDVDIINRLGAVGVVLLLFYAGMETDIQQLANNWKLAIFGTLIQIILSVFSVWLISLWVDWPLPRIVLIGFVISMSSSTIIIKLLEEKAQLNTPLGQGVLGISLAQDLAVVPMMIILTMLDGGDMDLVQVSKQVIGSLLAAAIFIYILIKSQVRLPLSDWLKKDKELQLFTALTICFGFSYVTAWLELSTALGAFLAGIIVGAAKQTEWVCNTLESLKVLFIALFFVSIGMLLNLDFLWEYWVQALLLLVAALVTNILINALILKCSKYDWPQSLYGGFILSPIGEFGFVLAAVGAQNNIIHDVGYQMALCVICLSLLCSPLWISIGGRILVKRAVKPL